MKFSSRFVVLIIPSLVSFLILNAACSSKSAKSTTKSAASSASGSNAAAEPLPPVQQTPGVPLSATTDIDGKAFSIDGASVTAHAVISTGECRRPVYLDANRVAFASRRASLERWQVFEADFAKKIERRVSFDAGDAEPVVALGRRLVIASSSDERKSGDRLLNKYRGVFAPKEETATPLKPADAKTGPTPAPILAAATPPPIELQMQHVLLEHPASGRKGTEWVRMSHETATSWSISVDKDVKQGLALQRSGSTTDVFRVAMALHNREPEARAWSAFKVENPTAAGAEPAKNSAPIVDGEMWPDGKQIVWSNGSIIWTTALNGKDAKRIGDDAIPAANDLAVDPTGQWIVFSSPTPTRGRNLMAIHKTGRCLKTLTELPGDETEPAFSPDGTKILFALHQGDTSVIGEIPFGSPAAIAAACP